MKAEAYLSMLVRDIHSTVVATQGEHGNPMTCVIDMMDADETGLYFLTAKGKPFYNRLKAHPTLALTGFKGTDTMHTIAISLTGEAKELGAELLPRLFSLNPYMAEIYPGEASRSILTVFCVDRGAGEVFQLNGKEISRDIFSWGGSEMRQEGYAVTKNCIGCGACAKVCPRSCIDTSRMPAVIDQQHCIHCGRCAEACPSKAIFRL